MDLAKVYIKDNDYIYGIGSVFLKDGELIPVCDRPENCVFKIERDIITIGLKSVDNIKLLTNVFEIKDAGVIPVTIAKPIPSGFNILPFCIADNKFMDIYSIYPWVLEKPSDQYNFIIRSLIDNIRLNADNTISTIEFDLIINLQQLPPKIVLGPVSKRNFELNIEKLNSVLKSKRRKP